MTPLPSPFLRLPLAHRGYHDAALGRPENGLSAFRAAVDAGYGIELDLQPSTDGHAMVFHDPSLDRMTREFGPVRDRTASALGEIALLKSQDTIPTLGEVLDLVNGRVPLLLELKNQEHRDDAVLETATAKALAGYSGPVAVMSFNPVMVARLAELIPAIPRGLTTDDFNYEPLSKARREHLREMRDFDEVGASFISHDALDLDRAGVAEIKAQGFPILTWTVRSPEAEHKARRIADNITFEGYAAAFP